MKKKSSISYFLAIARSNDDLCLVLCRTGILFSGIQIDHSNGLFANNCLYLCDVIFIAIGFWMDKMCVYLHMISDPRSWNLHSVWSGNYTRNTFLIRSWRVSLGFKLVSGSRRLMLSFNLINVSTILLRNRDQDKSAQGLAAEWPAEMELHVIRKAACTSYTGFQLLKLFYLVQICI